MIHILPYLEHTIRTKKSPQEIHDILQSATAPKREWFSDTPGDFIGRIDSYDFKIMSNIHIHYRNPFLPVINGTIRKEEGAYVVSLKMQLRLLTYVFLIIWFVFVGFDFLVGILYLITYESADATMVLLASGFLAFGQLISRCGFHFPAQNAIKRLEELLNEETPSAF